MKNRFPVFLARWFLPACLALPVAADAAALPSDIDLRVAVGDDRASLDIAVDNLTAAGFDDFFQRRFLPDIGGDGAVELAILLRSADGRRCSLVLVPSEISRERRLDATALAGLVRYENLDAFAGDGETCFVDANALVALGDVNGDGVRDLGIRTGGALVLHGRVDAGATVDVSALAPADGFHVSGTFFVGGNRDVGTVGDLDGDGLDDIGLGDRTGEDDRLRVLRGAPMRPVANAFRTLPDAALLVDIGLDFQFPEVIDLGDTNGDGIDDLLIATFFSGPYIVEGAPGLRLRAPTLEAIAELRLVDECGERGRLCRFGAAGDVDGDGLADIVGTVDGFPDEDQPSSYAGPEGFIVHGRTGGLPRVDAASELLDRGATELKDAARGPAGGIAGFTGFSGDADLNGDGLADILSGSGLVLLGDASRPSTIELDRLDGVNGLVYRGNQGAVFAGDIDGDGIDDLISDSRDGEPVAVLGRRDDGRPRSPVDVLVRYGPVTTDVLWVAPRVDDDIAGYRVFVDGVRVADADRDARSLTFEGPGADPERVIGIASVGMDGRTSPVIRYAFDRFGSRIGGLQGDVYGPTSGELRWPRGQVGDASVWRDEEYLETVRGSSLFLDDLLPGSSATYFITSAFVRPTDGGRSTLRSVGPLYPRSERLTLTTPADPNVPAEPPSPVGPDDPVDGVPAAPSGVRVAVYSASAFEVSWNRVSGASPTYEIAVGDRAIVRNDGTSLFVDEAGGRIDVTVIAVSADGQRSPPVTVTARPDRASAAGPAMPTGLRATRYSATAGELFWERDIVPGLRYEVRRGGRAVALADGTSHYTDALDAGSSASFEVITVNADGERSSPAEVTVGER